MIPQTKVFRNELSEALNVSSIFFVIFKDVLHSVPYFP